MPKGLAYKIIVFTLFVTMLMASVSAHPIPVSCMNAPHEPTIAGAPIYQGFKLGGHVGVDLLVRPGSPVFSVVDSVVIQTVQDSKTYGRYVMILHRCDQFASLYAHLSAIKVQFGDVVKAGQVIALSGGDPSDSIDGDGASKGYHLHFEIRPPQYLKDNQHNVDPLQYIYNIRKNMRYSFCINVR